MKDHAIFAIDCEKVINASWTAENMKSGQLLSIKVKPANSPAANFNNVFPTKIYVTLHSDQIIEIRDSGATVYD